MSHTVTCSLLNTPTVVNFDSDFDSALKPLTEHQMWVNPELKGNFTIYSRLVTFATRHLKINPLFVIHFLRFIYECGPASLHGAPLPITT